jgi:transcriptional regulator GlxA family with amidase domain
MRYFSAMRTVGLLVLPGTRAFDVAVAGEVWGVDRREVGIGPFELRVCAPHRSVTRLQPLGAVEPTHTLRGLAGCDLVIVPGRADPFAPVGADAVTALCSARRRGATIAALCSGAFTVAAAGLLDERPATTYWRLLDALAVAAPTARIQRDVLYVGDGPVLTSAGVVGGLDLCLHLVRRDHGAEVAAELARRLVMAPVREGGQAQYVPAPAPVRPAQPGVADTMDWALGRLAQPIGVPDMATHAAMSQRTFHRVFVGATGTTPGRWLVAQRVRQAQRLLETTDLSVERIARRCGLGTAENLRRHVRGVLGVNPGSYRRAFRSVA